MGAPTSAEWRPVASGGSRPVFPRFRAGGTGGRPAPRPTTPSALLPRPAHEAGAPAERRNRVAGRGGRQGGAGRVLRIVVHLLLLRRLPQPCHGRIVRKLTRDLRDLLIRGAQFPHRLAVLFTSRPRMPIPPLVKAVMRKDLLLGGGAGALLCALIVGAALSIGPLFGFDWGSGQDPTPSAGPAVRLPAIPDVPAPAADTLRPRSTGPRVLSRRTQPLTAARRGAVAQVPSVLGRGPQVTTAPTRPAATRPPTTANDAPTVPGVPGISAPAPARRARGRPAPRARPPAGDPVVAAGAGGGDARRRDPGDADARRRRR